MCTTSVSPSSNSRQKRVNKMASLNRVQVIGNLGRDPDVRSFPSGDRVANVTIATTDKWKDKQSGEMREATEWHRVVFGGRLAEIVEQYLRKGSQVYVEGSLRTRSEEHTSELQSPLNIVCRLLLEKK